MDSKTTVKISVLVEKISYLLNSIQSQGQVNKIDKDLMVGYVKELYETTLQLQTMEQSLPPQNYNAPQSNNGYYQNGNQQSFQNTSPQPSNGNGMNVQNGINNQHSKRSISEMLNASDKPSINETMKAGHGGLVDKLKQTPIKELSSYIGLNKRFAFINLLFNTDAMKYDEAINFIDSCATYQDAMSYVQNKLMKEYGWKEDDELLADLCNFILRRFLV